jgi:hypothetical protein
MNDELKQFEKAAKKMLRDFEKKLRINAVTVREATFCAIDMYVRNEAGYQSCRLVPTIELKHMHRSILVDAFGMYDEEIGYLKHRCAAIERCHAAWNAMVDAGVSYHGKLP